MSINASQPVMAEPPTVVHMPRKFADHAYDVYIGGAVSCGGWKLPDSKWKNTFTVEYCRGSRERALQLYRQSIVENPDLMASLDELSGKRLGCLCMSSHCHGHVLVDLFLEFINKTV